MGRTGNIFATGVSGIPWAGGVGAGCAGLLLAAGLWACAAMPVKMECSEIRTRLAMEDMNSDQRRFAQQELAECEGKLQAAERKDSAFINRVDSSFTPQDESEP